MNTQPPQPTRRMSANLPEMSTYATRQVSRSDIASDGAAGPISLDGPSQVGQDAENDEEEDR
mgnify:CR=1 FL=1